MCVDVCWSTSTCILTTVKMNPEPKKNSPGSSKKTAIHRKPQRYPAYPLNPQLQCCDRKCRASSTEMAVFFWRPPDTKFRRQHWIGGRGGHDLCGVVLHGMAVFFWRTRYDGIRDGIRFFFNVMSHASLLAFISNVFSSRKTTFICIYIFMFTIYIYAYLRQDKAHMNAYDMCHVYIMRMFAYISSWFGFFMCSGP